MAQLVEQRAAMPEVVNSTPAGSSPRLMLLSAKKTIAGEIHGLHEIRSTTGLGSSESCTL